jgi:hypothetical protein
MYRKNYFRGAKGIIKGRLNWKQIQNDTYTKEAKLEEEDIIDEEKLFYMGKQAFDEMMNVSRRKEQHKKKKGEYKK